MPSSVCISSFWTSSRDSICFLAKPRSSEGINVASCTALSKSGLVWVIAQLHFWTVAGILNRTITDAAADRPSSAPTDADAAELALCLGPNCEHHAIVLPTAARCDPGCLRGSRIRDDCASSARSKQFGHDR